MLEIQDLILTQVRISLSILTRTELLVSFLGCHNKSMAGTSPSQLLHVWWSCAGNWLWAQCICWSQDAGSNSSAFPRGNWTPRCNKHM